MLDEDNLILLLSDKAKKAVPYCWLLNGKPEDEESFHHFVDVSHENYMTLFKAAGFMNEKNRITRKHAEKLAQCITEKANKQHIVQVTTFTDKSSFIL